jgi:hypothetical protein
MKKIGLILVAVIVFISCEKARDRQLIIENSDIPLISEVIMGNETYMKYTYNEANLPVEEKSKFHYTRHFYNDMNQITASDFYWDISMASSNSSVIEAAMSRTEWVNPKNTPKSISHEYIYSTDGQLKQKAFIRPTDNTPEYNSFTYENGRISRQTMFWKSGSVGFIDYIYNDNGNLIKELRYDAPAGENMRLSTTTEYEYDNMPNPYLAFKRLLTPGIYTNLNNITKETYTLNFDVDPFTEKVQVKTNSYEYNDRGYPVKINGSTEYRYK